MTDHTSSSSKSSSLVDLLVPQPPTLPLPLPMTPHQSAIKTKKMTKKKRGIEVSSLEIKIERVKGLEQKLKFTSTNLYIKKEGKMEVSFSFSSFFSFSLLLLGALSCFVSNEEMDKTKLFVLGVRKGESCERIISRIYLRLVSKSYKRSEVFEKII
ncbi:hypothetical protein OIU84_002190 [Salix udensis]|uniref:Uncharacterized protein n=1 Tax=Salix udensis TaxID=889485 RepID=A0AAD6P4C8_9ROSI|nr:hypothetical protein OIU84_002190 [Salix udensis]